MPIVHLTFGNTEINCLIDTGSDTSLMKPQILKYKNQKLQKPIKYNSLGGIGQVTHVMRTPFPKEFKVQGDMEWKIFPLKSNKYDGIIGMNFLTPLDAKLDLKSQSIKILSKYKIPFEDINLPREIAQANHLETVPNSEEEIYKQTNSASLDREEKQLLKNLLKQNKDLFYLEGDNLTFTHEVKHEIKTKDQNPIFCKIYRYPQIHEKEIEKQMNEMLNQGIIRESNSPYNSPLWIVPKKSDNSGKKKWRVVIDYRKLNEITVDDKFPIPNIENILDKLGKAQYFTKIDLAKGFHQILMDEKDQKKTAFSTPFGHYEYVRMPFGLKNAPATFQRMINSVLREYINKICVVYLDDILIFSTSLQEHIDSINKIFKVLRKAQLKIQINKCSFFQKETDYLGHILTKDGIKPNNEKIDQILKLKLPATQKQIKSFLGVTGYYRKFIKDYAKVAKPLTHYLKKEKKINLSDPAYINAFEELKTLLTTHPILKYPDFNKPFKINTDASKYALGAVLTQEGQPIAYVSRTLNSHEINYGTPEKELLAVVWACKYFRPYIYGKEFHLETDHEALKWLHTKYLGKDLNPRLQRWILSLGEYNIKINYLKGKNNKIADFLSRINSEYDEIEGFANEVPKVEINALDNESLNVTMHSQPEGLNNYIPIMDTVVNRFRTQIIIDPESLDHYEEILGNKRIYLNPNLPPPELTEELKNFLERPKAAIYTTLSDHDFNKIQLLLIQAFPHVKFIRCNYFAQDIRNEDTAIKIIAKEHKSLSHPGIIALYENVKNRIYYPQLRTIINKLTNNCDVCNRGKYDRKPIKAKFLKTEMPSDKNQIIHVDIYTNTKQKFMTFIDKFSKFATIYPIQHNNHTEIIEKLRIYFNHKKPNRIVADRDFKDVNIKDFLREQSIELHLCKPNSHTGNSDIERLHNTITEKIRILNLDKPNPISTQALEAVNLYNQLFHNTVKNTPSKIEADSNLREITHKYLQDTQTKRLDKLNKNRENYVETRDEGYIKYYKSLRHKGQPKYRKYKLNNIHTSNIKRPLKFLDDTNHPIATDDDPTDSDATSSREN